MASYRTVSVPTNPEFGAYRKSEPTNTVKPWLCGEPKASQLATVACRQCHQESFTTLVE